MKTPQTAVSDGNLRVVLNGGNNVIASATLSCQWFLSEQALRDAKGVIIIVQTKDESEKDDSDYLGDRYVFDVSAATAFLQFFSPGDHVVTVIATTNRIDAATRKLLRMRHSREHARMWKHSMTPRDDYYLCASRALHVAAISQEIVSIPDGVFAKRSRGVIGAKLWSLTKKVWGTPPRDECEYRWKMPLAVLLWALLLVVSAAMAIIAITVLVIRALIFTLVMPTARMVAFFVGFRPVFLFEGILTAWSYQPEERLAWDVRYHSTYRLWERSWRTKDGKDKYMLFAPWEVCLLLCIVFVAVKWRHELISLGSFGAGILVAGIALGIALSLLALIRIPWFCRQVAKVGKAIFSKKEETEGRQLAPVPLTEVRQLTQKERSLLLPNALAAIKGAPLPQTPRTIFWAAKQKVCKPFAR